MDKTRVLVIRYDNKIKQSEIPLFRGAVIATMEGNADVMYHNHSESGVLYRYPLIQYKRINQCAAIVAIDAGVDVMGQSLSSGVSSLCIGNRQEVFSVCDVKSRMVLVQVWNGEFDYALRKWLPLNSKNYEEYEKIEILSDRISFLERILIGNIISFAKGIGVSLDKHIECAILSIDSQAFMIYKGVRMLSLDLKFKTNVSLPNFIGIGKGVSLGFGTVHKCVED